MSEREEMPGHHGISSEIMNADTLAMDSMDFNLDGNVATEAVRGSEGEQQRQKQENHTGDEGTDLSDDEDDEMDDGEGVDILECRTPETESLGDGEAKSQDYLQEDLALDPSIPEKEAPQVANDEDGTKQRVVETSKIELEVGLVAVQGEEKKPIRDGKTVTVGGNWKKVSQYVQFFNQNKEALKVELSAAGKPFTACVIAKILSEQWQALSDIEKQNYSNEHDDASQLDDSAGMSEKQSKDISIEEGDEGVIMKEARIDDVELDRTSVEFVAPFPITRVKRIIRLDKDIKLVSRDGIALINEAAALFLEELALASFTIMLQHKRKSIRGPDVVLAAKSSRKFRDCLGNDLETLLEESENEDEDDADMEEHGSEEDPILKRPKRQKSGKKEQLPPPPGSRPITNFFKA